MIGRTKRKSNTDWRKRTGTTTNRKKSNTKGAKENYEKRTEKRRKKRRKKKKKRAKLTDGANEKSKKDVCNKVQHRYQLL